MKIGSRTVVRLLALSLSASCFAETADDGQTQVYFGDTHLHTSYSFDAFLNNNFSADPETAYRWAKGEPVIHPYNRARVQINTPLDFLVVSDHAEMLGRILLRRQKSIMIRVHLPASWAGSGVRFPLAPTCTVL